MISLTLSAIRAWAESLPENAVVGTRKHECGCPLANYVRAQGAIQAWVNYDNLVYQMPNNVRYIVRASEGVWRTLVTVVDYRSDVIPRYDPITREQFLTMLTIAEEEVNSGITR